MFIKLHDIEGGVVWVHGTRVDAVRRGPDGHGDCARLVMGSGQVMVVYGKPEEVAEHLNDSLMWLDRRNAMEPPVVTALDGDPS